MFKHLSVKACMLLVIAIFGFQYAFAQTGSVTGIVSDAGDGTTLPGATVVVKGTTSGTVTDIDGNFSLNVDGPVTLEVSFVGYTTHVVDAKAGDKLTIELLPDAAMLDAAVVIGYGTVKKKDATGSVTAVSSNDFNKGAITSPTSLIAGKVAGVSVVSSGGAPGSGSTIRIRGGSSLSANNDPLVVIDGVITSGEGGSGSRSALNSVNPNDIETFTVLKDASATAIYGSRASNGVILITTKKGRVGAPLRLEYSGKFAYTEKPKGLDVLSTDEFVTAFSERNPDQTDLLGVWYDANGQAVPAITGGADPDSYTNQRSSTDWQDEIYRSAFMQDHNISATGSWKMLPYRISAGYTGQEGTLETSNFQRTTLSAALNPVFFDDHLKVNVNANASFIKNRFADNGSIGAAVQMDPTKPVNYENGDYFYWMDNNGDPSSQSTDNPVAMLMQKEDNSNANRFYGNVQLDYKMHFLPELRANLNLAMDHTNNDGTVYSPNTAAFTNNGAGAGTDNEYSSNNKNDLLDFYLDYTKEVESIESKFALMGGYSWQHFYNESDFSNSNIPVIDPATGLPVPPQYLDTLNGVDKEELYLVSFFGRFNYSFKDKYLLTATVRDDGTSRFSPDNRWGIFPSVSVAWKINEEAFLKDSKTLSQLKLRLSWGETGQQDVGGYYGYMGRYSYGNQTALYPFGNQYYTILRPSGYNPNLKWETTETMNVGIDYGFFGDRLYGQLDVYKRKTRDLLAYVPEVLGANLTNYIDKNIGSLENTGFELSVNGIIISQEEMFWEVGANMSYNVNEITDLDGNEYDVTGISGGVGNYIQLLREGYANHSFYVYEQVYDTDGNPIEGMYVDRNGDGEINSDDKYIYKNSDADVLLGLSTSFQYKEWSLFMAGRASFGNYVYNNSASEIGVYERLFRSEGPYASNVASSVLNTGFVTPQYWSDYYVEDGSFFRMDDITLSYTFNDLVNGKLDLRLSATCNNAFVITNYSGLDPEVYSGVDNNLYPRSRVWTFGLNLQF